MPNRQQGAVFCEQFLCDKMFDLCKITNEVLECSICLENIECKRCHVVLTCGHSYHFNCIFNQQRCPICRK